ncbi:hypothetical protein PAXRUDRAFT_829586 [Paxillus rubicundulus Ve08.2h10]|uniref:Uncharacterized protein n=1 Tax=Paxillus rubicundulus Ve08.2h10 TaxID=930991 RepID=A0A0D0E5Q0_9AGAM|nr:hypothetical protein PAXRUDRAFT_829586 [Paxillus rubicundulus Ve08.2h10]
MMESWPPTSSRIQCSYCICVRCTSARSLLHSMIFRIFNSPVGYTKNSSSLPVSPCGGATPVPTLRSPPAYVCYSRI